MTTKVAVYRAVCLSVLLYASKTFVLYARHIKLLEAFHIRCLKRILGIPWRDRIPHTEVLRRSNLQSIECRYVDGWSAEVDWSRSSDA